MLSTTPLVFGQYVPSRNVPSDFTATLNLTCVASGTTSATFQGTIGLIGSGEPGGRDLADGRHRLRYQLFVDPARTILWGDGSGDTRTLPTSGTVGPTAPMRQTFTIYGRILARQTDAAVGNYRDQITAVLNY
jgi:spore coat protein U-like protein